MTDTHEKAPATKPLEVLDLVRFLCATWKKLDHWAYEHADGEDLSSYPVIPGLHNQISLERIGDQPYDVNNIKPAIQWMLSGAYSVGPSRPLEGVK